MQPIMQPTAHSQTAVLQASAAHSAPWPQMQVQFQQLASQQSTTKAACRATAAHRLPHQSLALLAIHGQSKFGQMSILNNQLTSAAGPSIAKQRKPAQMETPWLRWTALNVGERWCMRLAVYWHVSNASSDTPSPLAGFFLLGSICFNQAIHVPKNTKKNINPRQPIQLPAPMRPCICT